VIGAGSFSVADEAADDLQAGIDAFNSGDLPGAMTLYEKAAEAGSPEATMQRTTRRPFTGIVRPQTRGIPTG
jgi:hypothetical protein